MWTKFKRPVIFFLRFNKSLATPTMKKLTIEQRVKVIEAIYENGRSNRNEFHALRDIFGQHNRPTESAIGNNVTLLWRGSIPAFNDK